MKLSSPIGLETTPNGGQMNKSMIKPSSKELNILIKNNVIIISETQKEIQTHKKYHHGLETTPNGGQMSKSIKPLFKAWNF